MIRLRKMTEEEFLRFKEYSTADYAKDLMSRESLDVDQAFAMAVKDFSEALPDGLETQGQFLMTIEEVQNHMTVGCLWFHYEEQQVFLDDFLIHEAERRKGYATAALLEMERMAKADGCTESVLFVWDHDPEAAALYRRCGYDAVSRIDGGSYMRKEL